MSSQGPNHDELDFEFLGNVSGEPYIVQTNLYINGTGDREQRHYLWFDPTLDFHTYSFLWNRRSILYLTNHYYFLLSLVIMNLLYSRININVLLGFLWMIFR